MTSETYSVSSVTMSTGRIDVTSAKTTQARTSHERCMATTSALMRARRAVMDIGGMTLVKATIAIRPPSR